MIAGSYRYIALITRNAVLLVSSGHKDPCVEHLYLGFRWCQIWNGNTKQIQDGPKECEHFLKASCVLSNEDTLPIFRYDINKGINNI